MNRRLRDIPNRSVSCVDQGEVGLDAVAGRQALLQQRRELLRELLPVLFPDLVLEAMKDLGEGGRQGGKKKNFMDAEQLTVHYVLFKQSAPNIVLFTAKFRVGF